MEQQQQQKARVRWLTKQDNVETEKGVTNLGHFIIPRRLINSAYRSKETCTTPFHFPVHLDSFEIRLILLRDLPLLQGDGIIRYVWISF